MFSQLGQMMSQAGASGQAGPVNYEMAEKVALQGLPAMHPASSVDVDKVRDAIRLAEVWLDGVTGFPAGERTVTAWNPRQWVQQTMPTWKLLCTPIAERVSSSWTDALPQELAAQVGPMLGMMQSMGGMTFGTQLGQGLAKLSTEVLTSTDIGIPLGPDGTAALLPTAVAEFGQGLGLDEDQVRLYLALREAAHHRLYAAAPWLRQRVIDLVAAYAAGITVDFSEIENLAGQFDPSNPAAINELLSGQGESAGLLEPKITPGQESTLRNLETLLALVEGWVDTVVTDAVGDRLPGAAALQETMRRRRASGGPAEQAFANLIGLQMRPRRLRAAAQLWKSVADSRDAQARDALWGDPDLLPSSADLDDPEGFLQRDKQFSELLAGLDDVQTIEDLEKLDSASDPGPAQTGADAGEHADKLPDNGERAEHSEPSDERQHGGEGQDNSERQDGDERPDNSEGQDNSGRPDRDEPDQGDQPGGSAPHH
ncbi:zinc-dependent metalloprotease [Nakamurella sp. DB0629]|uniref:Zinc-dependent metalloprotease n=2 Tax=Nakamurella aerolata TaxID=1656892 RepID=A0A849AF27_9ACTN|nr:zinc-dependent metalloprotease [Nakamurella aerolata]